MDLVIWKVVMFDDIIGNVRGIRDELNDEFKNIQSPEISKEEKRALIKKINELLKKV